MPNTDSEEIWNRGIPWAMHPKSLFYKSPAISSQACQTEARLQSSPMGVYKSLVTRTPLKPGYVHRLWYRKRFRVPTCHLSWQAPQGPVPMSSQDFPPCPSPGSCRPSPAAQQAASCTSTLCCYCSLCLPLTAGPSLAAPRSENYPIIPLAQHGLPSSELLAPPPPSPFPRAPHSLLFPEVVLKPVNSKRPTCPSVCFMAFLSNPESHDQLMAAEN